MHECANCGKRTDTSYEDIWSKDHCSSRCASGLMPFCGEGGEHPYYCDMQVTQKPGRYDRDVGGYYTEITCSKCQNEISGWLS